MRLLFELMDRQPFLVIVALVAVAVILAAMIGSMVSL